MHQPPSTNIGGIKPLCQCDTTTICDDCAVLINLGRSLCDKRHYVAVKLMALIYYAHRRIELKRCHEVGHPVCVRDAIQDMDHITDGATALSGVTKTGWAVWEPRVVKSKKYEHSRFNRS